MGMYGDLPTTAVTPAGCKRIAGKGALAGNGISGTAPLENLGGNVEYGVDDVNLENRRFLECEIRRY